jgi:hypothetical protein
MWAMNPENVVKVRSNPWCCHRDSATAAPLPDEVLGRVVALSRRQHHTSTGTLRRSSRTGGAIATTAPQLAPKPAKFFPDLWRSHPDSAATLRKTCQEMRRPLVLPWQKRHWFDRILPSKGGKQAEKRKNPLQSARRLKSCHQTLKAPEYAG